MKGSIYAIIDRRVDRVCYVGQTRQAPSVRWEQHRTRNSRVSQEIRAAGVEAFAFEVIETVDVADLNDREAHWIIALDTMHPKGMNRVRGGRSAAVSAATRAATSAASKATWASPGFKSAMRDRRKKLWQDPGYQAKIAEARRLMWADPEKKASIVAAQNEARARSGEARKTHAERMRAKWADPEFKAAQRAAISKAHKRLSEDPAHRQALKEKALARWAEHV